jgi:hypothetical protein
MSKLIPSSSSSVLAHTHKFSSVINAKSQLNWTCWRGKNFPISKEPSFFPLSLFSFKQSLKRKKKGEIFHWLVSTKVSLSLSRLHFVFRTKDSMSGPRSHISLTQTTTEKKNLPPSSSSLVISGQSEMKWEQHAPSAYVSTSTAFFHNPLSSPSFYLWRMLLLQQSVVRPDEGL